MKKININEFVVVRLTEQGERAWRDSWKSVDPDKVPDEIRKAATLPDGRTRFQIHELMHTFGPLCYNGSRFLPFVNNTLEFDDADFEREQNAVSEGLAGDRGAD